MEAIEVIYVNGAFRPVAPITLPEATRGKVVLSVDVEQQQEDGRRSVYAILSERYNSGHADTAARHNEHQP